MTALRIVADLRIACEQCRTGHPHQVPGDHWIRRRDSLDLPGGGFRLVQQAQNAKGGLWKDRQRRL
jgi:hypothetical protein